ncbi:sodium:solute symporter family transporter [Chitinophaga niabensis]|uniref:Cyclically-permuted mutarotase family protein n=1 Tax=Chitinophaga niabensis TaxID=536979 RepID=A0A1N6JZL1_9BACT|nr:sodium/solute symporter [Chitinophaga niabensis]SIO49663.1 cyclically-permuted mutarotase family protein [Chitinophaga niabensis]
MRSTYFIILTFLSMFSISGLRAQEQANNHITWSVPTQLPPAQGSQQQPGLAGIVAGVHQNLLLLAGGANFPDNMPWQGGHKKYYDDVYLMQKDNQWMKSSFKLPFHIAYAASVSTTSGILCIGGENETGPLKSVLLLQWDAASQTLKVKNMPELPIPLTNASAALQGNTVYVAGGETADSTLSVFFSLDLVNGTSWNKLPDLPLAVSHSVMVAQSNGEYPCIYVFGGRTKTPAGISTLHNSAYQFDLKHRQWKKLSNISAPALSAGTGIATGATYVLLIGGDKGDVFTQIETFNAKISSAASVEIKQQLQTEKIALLEKHKGFSRDIYLFNTVTNTWTKIGELPYETPVTTTAVKWGTDIYIPGGEIKPGVRSTSILKGTIDRRQFFSWTDYTILVLYLLLMVGIGVWTSRHQDSTDDYFRGGQKVPGWATGLSIFGAKLSAITFIGIPAKTYATNWTYFILLMTIIMVMPLVIRFFIPFYRRLNVTSAYEYLEKRFSYVSRFLASILFILLQLGRMGIVLLLPSIALSVVTGIPVTTCILIMGIVSIFYTVLGGVEAVIWTEVVQVIILLGGALLSLILLPMHLGTDGRSAWNSVVTNDKLKLLDFNFDLSSPTLWVVLIGGLALNLTVYGTDQTVVQRYLTTKDEKTAANSLKLGAWMVLPSTIIFFSLGTLLYLFYQNHPEKVNIALDTQDTIFPWYIVNELPDGISGLVITAIFAAAMGSLNGSVNAVSTVFVNDFYRKFFPGKSEKNYLNTARAATLLVGIFGTVIALVMAGTGIVSLWDQFNTILGLFTGGIAGLFVLGIFTKRANAFGAAAGLIASGICQFLIYRYTQVNLLLYALTGLASCAGFGYIFSLIGGHTKSITGLTVFKNH